MWLLSAYDATAVAWIGVTVVVVVVVIVGYVRLSAGLCVGSIFTAVTNVLEVDIGSAGERGGGGVTGGCNPDMCCVVYVAVVVAFVVEVVKR